MKKLIATVAVAGVLAACGGGGGGNDSNTTTSKLSLAVTDAPVDNADAVVLSFTGVELLDAGGEVLESFSFDTPKSIDLLDLQGDNSAFLLEYETVPPGVYEQVRLIVDTENASCNNLVAPFDSYITVDGTDYPLVVPGGGASGFKVVGPLTVATGGLASYTVDFDLRRSIAERGATGCYNVNPVLHVVDNAQVGTLAGTIDGAMLVNDSCPNSNPTTGEGSAVYLFADAPVVPDDVDGNDPEPLTSSLLTPDGQGGFTYEIGFLLAGNYTIAVTCQAGDDDPETDDAISFQSAADVTIEAGVTTTQDFSVAP